MLNRPIEVSTHDLKSILEFRNIINQPAKVERIWSESEHSTKWENDSWNSYEDKMIEEEKILDC